MDNLPLAVKNCSDPVLQENAVRMFTRGTPEQIQAAVFECVQHNKARERLEAKEKQRREFFRILNLL